MEDSPAKTSASQDAERVWLGSAPAFGGGSPVPFATFDPDSLSWKTLQLSLLEDSATFSQTWPRAGMTRSGIAYQRQPSAPLTVVTAYSSLPTPSASEYGSNQSPSPGAAVRPSLQQMARTGMWPTPTRSDGMGGPGNSGRDGGENLRTAVGGQLNPTWVSVLMGFPPHWTELEDE